MSERERIDELVRNGRVSEEEAAELRRHVGELEERSRRSAGDDRRPVGKDLQSRFLRGEIDADELLRRVRRLTVLIGLGWGAATAILCPPALALLSPSPPGELVAFGLSMFLLGGPAFGLGMYFGFVRPRFRRLLRMAALLGGPFEPLQGTAAGQCPACGAERWRLSNDLLARWHWRVNPVVGLVELGLGLRFPRDLRMCRECGTDFVACRACERSFDGRSWGRHGLLMRWRRALRCPGCDDELPLQQNVLTAAVRSVQRHVGRTRGREPAPSGERR